MSRRILLGAFGVVAGAVGIVACPVQEPVTNPAVTVQRLYVDLDDTGTPLDAGCWTTLSSNDDAGLSDGGWIVGLGDSCTSPSPDTCALIGGSDQLRVLVGYDALSFDPGANPPLPTITETLDGVVADAGASVSAVPSSSPIHYVATLTAPPEEVSEMLLAVDVAPGFSYQVPTSFVVDAPYVSLGVSVCNVSECSSPAAAVGFAEVVVGVPGPAPAAVTVTTKIGGEVQPTTYTVQASTPGPVTRPDTCVSSPKVPGFVGTVLVPVPVINGGQEWDICAQASGSDVNCQPMPMVPTLSSPTPTVTVENCAVPCAPKPCTLPAGVGNVTVDLTFPGATAVQALLTSEVDGVVQGSPQMVSLATQTFDADGGSLMNGTATLPVPVGTKWSLLSQVDAWSSTPVSVALTSPALAVMGSLHQAGCAGTTPAFACAGLGPVSFDLQLNGVSAPQNVTLAWYLDGAPQGPSQLVALDVVGDAVCGPVGGTASLAVPAVFDASWEIWGQVGNAAPQKLVGPVTVQPPAITVALDCGGTYAPFDTTTQDCKTMCPVSLSPDGGTIDLEVTAPQELASPAVSVSTVFAGTTQGPTNGTLSLNPLTNQLEAHVPIALPAAAMTGDAFAIDATVGGFLITSCFAL